MARALNEFVFYLMNFLTLHLRLYLYIGIPVIMMQPFFPIKYWYYKISNYNLVLPVLFVDDILHNVKYENVCMEI